VYPIKHGDQGRKTKEYDDVIRTLTNRHISSPLSRFVSKMSSATQVTSHFPSRVIATPPAVYRGAIVRAFLNLAKN